MLRKLSILLLVLVFIAGFTSMAMAIAPVSPDSINGVYKLVSTMNCKDQDGKRLKIKKSSKKYFMTLRFIDDPDSDIAGVGWYFANVYREWDKKTNTLSGPVVDCKNADDFVFAGFELNDNTDYEFDSGTGQFKLSVDEVTRLVNGFLDNVPVEGKKIAGLCCDLGFQGRFKGNEGKTKRRMKGWNRDVCFFPEQKEATTGTPPVTITKNWDNIEAKCKSKFKATKKAELPATEPINQDIDILNYSGQDVTYDSTNCVAVADLSTALGAPCSATLPRFSTVLITAATPVSWTGCDAVDGNAATTDGTICTVILDTPKTIDGSVIPPTPGNAIEVAPVLPPVTFTLEIVNTSGQTITVPGQVDCLAEVGPFVPPEPFETPTCTYTGLTGTLDLTTPVNVNWTPGLCDANGLAADTTCTINFNTNPIDRLTGKESDVPPVLGGDIGTAVGVNP